MEVDLCSNRVIRVDIPGHKQLLAIKASKILNYFEQNLIIRKLDEVTFKFILAY